MVCPQEMPEEEFLKNRSALVAAKMQKDHSMSDETDRSWDRIWRGSLDFASREQEAAALEELQLADVLVSRGTAGRLAAKLLKSCWLRVI